MSSWNGDNPFDYLPPHSQRYWQRNDSESFIQGPPTSYARTRMQTGFHQSHLLEEPVDRYNRNRVQPGFPHSRPSEEHTDQYNRSRVQPGFSQSSPPEEPADLYIRSRVLHGFPYSRLSEEVTDWHNRNRTHPGFVPSEEPPSFQSSQNPGFLRSRLPSNSRRLTGGELFGFNTLPTTRVTVYEEVVRGNGFPTQPPPDRSSIPWHMQHQRNRRSPGDESKMTIDEQSKVLSKLRKEKYNPATPKQRGEAEEWKRCSVCLEDFEAKEEVTVTPCHHMFHGECIVPWVTKEGSCPVCRSVLLEKKKPNASPPAVDRDLLEFVRALALDDEDDVRYQNMIPLFLLGR